MDGGRARRALARAGASHGPRQRGRSLRRGVAHHARSSAGLSTSWPANCSPTPISRSRKLMREMANLDAAAAAVPFDLLRPLLQAQAATAKLGWNPYLHNPKLRGPARPDHRADPRRPRAQTTASSRERTPRRTQRGFAVSRIADLETAAHLAAIERPVELSEMVVAFLDERSIS